MLGYESTMNRVYGYAQDMMAVLVTIDNGVTWQAVSSSVLIEDKLLASWTSAIQIPENNDANLFTATPHTSYTQGTWGGNILSFVCSIHCR